MKRETQSLLMNVARSLILLLLTWNLSLMRYVHSQGDHDHIFTVGLGKSDITGPVAGMVFMGYANPLQAGRGLLNRLYCRVYAISSPEEETVLLIHTDLMGISLRLRQRVVQRLQLKYPSLQPRNILLHAQHTHSGPGGYFSTFMYYMTNFGFSANHFSLLEDRILQAVDQAMVNENKFLAEIYLSKVALNNTGRNRSPEAFALNPEWEKQEFLTLNSKEMKNNKMSILRIYDVRQKKNRGLISFFAIHPTNIPKTNVMVSSDNKGFAEYYLERKYEDLMVSFFQTDSGDVSPNMVDYDLDRRHFTGEGRTYVESCEIIGMRQALAAERALFTADERKLSNRLNGRFVYENFTDYDLGNNKKTCKPMSGASHLDGTEDGRGLPCIREGFTVHEMNSSIYQKACGLSVQYSANFFNHQLFGSSDTYETRSHTNLRSDGIGDWVKTRVLGNYAYDNDVVECQYPKVPAMDQKQELPELIPLQVLQLGEFLLAAVPFEVTSMAGYRIRNEVEADEVLGLSNGYVSYMTTPEEYMSQQYEGGFTLFGKWQLNATIDILKKLKTSLSSACEYGCLEQDNNDDELGNNSLTNNINILVAPEEFKLKHHWLTEVFARKSLFFPFSRYLPDAIQSSLLLQKYLNPIPEVGTLVSFENRNIIRAEFICVHPAHSQQLVTSFCDVLKDSKVIQTDKDWNVRFKYNRQALMYETCTCEWLPFNDQKTFNVSFNGIYRLRMNGAMLNENNQVELFNGLSPEFKFVNDHHEVYYSVDEYEITVNDEQLLAITVVLWILLAVLKRLCYKERKAVKSIYYSESDNNSF